MFSICIPRRSFKYKLPAGRHLATKCLLVLRAREKNRGGIVREGGVYFFKQPKHGTELFHQLCPRLLCWQPAAGSSLAPAFICFSLLLNSLLPNIYCRPPPPAPSFFSPLFLFNPFSLLVCPQEGCFPSLPHKSKAACVEGAVTGVKHDATLNGPRGGGGEEKPHMYTQHMYVLL